MVQGSVGELLLRRQNLEAPLPAKFMPEEPTKVLYPTSIALRNYSANLQSGLRCYAKGLRWWQFTKDVQRL
jgi:hypothetical protein